MFVMSAPCQLMWSFKRLLQPEELCLKFHTLDEPNTSAHDPAENMHSITASGDSKAEHPGSTAEAEKEL